MHGKPTCRHLPLSLSLLPLSALSLYAPLLLSAAAGSPIYLCSPFSSVMCIVLAAAFLSLLRLLSSMLMTYCRGFSRISPRLISSPLLHVMLRWWSMYMYYGMIKERRRQAGGGRLSVSASYPHKPPGGQGDSSMGIKGKITILGTVDAANPRQTPRHLSSKQMSK